MQENATQEKRIKELFDAFEGVDEKTMQVIRPIIAETAYLEEELSFLRGLPKLRVHPTDPQRQQQTPAAKMYKEYLQQYTNCIKVLAAVQRKDGAEEVSPLRQWLEERAKANGAG